MRYPQIEQLEMDCLANPRSSTFHHWAKHHDAFNTPVEVHLPNGATIKRKLELDPDAMPSTFGTLPISILHRNQRLWVSALPFGIEAHKVVFAAWDPDEIFGGPAAQERPKFGVARSWLRPEQAQRFFDLLDRKGDATAQQIITTCKKAGRARVKLSDGKTAVLHWVAKTQTETGALDPLVCIEIWPKHGVKPGLVFGDPGFTGIISAQLRMGGMDVTGVAFRMPELDRIGHCHFVPDNNLLGLSRGYSRGISLPFADLTHVAEPSPRQIASVEAYQAIRAQVRPGITLEQVSRKPITEEDLDWARDRALPLMGQIAAVDQSVAHHVMYELALMATAMADGEKDIWVRAFMGDGWFERAMAKMPDPLSNPDLNRIVSFWGRQRSDMVEHAMRHAVDDARLIEVDGAEGRETHKLTAAYMAGALSARAGRQEPFDLKQRDAANQARIGHVNESRGLHAAGEADLILGMTPTPQDLEDEMAPSF